MHGFMTALHKYAQFTGRSRRGEFWGYHLVLFALAAVVSVLYAIGLGMAEASGESSALTGIASGLGVVLYLGFVVPTVALGWRRCQDIGVPGAVAIIGMLLPLVMWIVGAVPGSPGENRYGPEPSTAD